MVELKSHHPLPFQSLHKYSSTIPYGKITSIPLTKLLLSPSTNQGSNLPCEAGPTGKVTFILNALQR